jgi:uncharacterized protein YcfJ
MNKFAIFAVLSIISFGAIAGDARVVATEPVYNNITQHRQTCVPVTQTQRSVGGTLLGGAIGAAIGNQVGGGSGRDIATVVGAITGATVGQNVAGDRVVTRTQCVTEPFTTQTISQYRVTVDINGSYHVIYRPYSPMIGSMIPVTMQVQ